MIKFFEITKIRIVFKNTIRILNDLRFALFLLFFIALISSLGSFIEQDQPNSFYEKAYPQTHPVYGFIDYHFLFFFGLDHIYKTYWFFFLLIILGFSLLSCTITRQFPLFKTSKEYFFKKKRNSFQNLPFFTEWQNLSFLKEYIVLKLEFQQFYLYQKKNFVYGYKGLIGRLSPILVHISLILILSGSLFGALKSFQAQEFLPKGEISQIQNSISTGFFTAFPKFAIRVNDFWVDYKKEKIHQFYSDLSILNPNGSETKQYTISVNNPLHYQGTDLYQSDWNLLGIRASKTIFKNVNSINLQQKIIESKQKENNSPDFLLNLESIDQAQYEFPLFSVKENKKYWITWIPKNFQEDSINLKKKTLDSKKSIELISKINSSGSYYLVFDQFEELISKYDENGKFIQNYSIGEKMNFKDLDFPFVISEIISSTGLLIKQDPSIWIIYLGFGLLMITTFLSLLPYNQIWIFEQSPQKITGLQTFHEKNTNFIAYYYLFEKNKKKNLISLQNQSLGQDFFQSNLSLSLFYFGASSNRGKIQLEIEFENFIRELRNSFLLIFKQYFK